MGDWMTHTHHLTWYELAAYHKLIEAYYLTEQALPADMPAVYRIVHAATRDEKDATRNVLNEFFALDPIDNRWHQKRCDAEIERYRAVRQTKVENVSKRFNKLVDNSSTDGQQALTSHSGKKHEKVSSGDKHAGIPPRPLQAPATPNEPTGRQQPLNGPNTGDFLTINQVLIPLNRHSISNVAAAREAAVRVCLEKGIQVKAEDPRLATLIADGATSDDFAAAASIAVTAGRGWAYCAGIVANRIADATRIAREGPQKPSGSSLYPMLPRWHDPR
jgi:uncharacterized protein YdaU (DUF1376 family)